MVDQVLRPKSQSTHVTQPPVSMGYPLVAAGAREDEVRRVERNRVTALQVGWDIWVLLIGCFLH